jgi:hypothetical protein
MPGRSQVHVQDGTARGGGRCRPGHALARAARYAALAAASASFCMRHTRLVSMSFSRLRATSPPHSAVLQRQCRTLYGCALETSSFSITRPRSRSTVVIRLSTSLTSFSQTFVLGLCLM